jgi:hypothetical protein
MNLRKIIKYLADLLDVEYPSGTPTDGQVLTYDGVSSKWKPEDLSGVGDMSTIQLHRSSNLTLTGSFIDVPFDVIDVENNTTVLERDDTNTDRILIKEDGYYLVSYAGVICLDIIAGNAELRVRKNDTTILNSSYQKTWNSDADILANTFAVQLSENDYLTLQASGPNTTCLYNVNFNVTKLQGSKGEKGDPGGTTVDVQEDDVTKATNIDILNFEGNVSVIEESGGKATITIEGEDNLVYTCPIVLQASGANYWTINHALNQQFPQVTTLFKPSSGNYQGQWINAESVLTIVYHDENNLRIYNDSGSDIGTTLATYAHYKLNESSGDTVSDSSGNGRNGTRTNMEDVDWIVGKLNNGLRFDGVDEVVNCGNIASFEYNQAFSLECWFKTTHTGGSIVPIGKRDCSGIRNGYSVALNPSYSNWIVVIAHDDPANNDIDKRFNLDITPNDGNWHHLVVTYDGSGLASGVNLYVDGSSQSVASVWDNLSGSIITSCPLGIGARNGNVSSNFWVGDLDEVVIYDIELTSGEVGFRYNSGSGTEDMDFGGVKVVVHK